MLLKLDLKINPKVKSVKDEDGNVIIVSDNTDFDNLEPVIESGIQNTDEPPAITSYEYVKGKRVRVTKTVEESEPPLENVDKNPSEEADETSCPEVDAILVDFLKNMP